MITGQENDDLELDFSWNENIEKNYQSNKKSFL